MKKNKYFLAIIVVVIGLIAIFPCIYFMNSLERYTLKDNAYQVINGVHIDYDIDSVLEKDEDNVYVKSSKVTVPSFPIYYQDQIACLLPHVMGVVNTESAETKKVNYFSKLYQKDNKIYLEENNKSRVITNSFLFDGEDTYLFLEETDITYHKKTMTLSPLSYVKVIKNQEIQYYDYKNDLFQTEKVSEQVVAQIKTEKIYLHTDILKTGDIQVLLYGNVKDLPNY